MTDRARVIEHLQIVRTWASVGKEPIYNGIEPRCCEDVEKWMDDALALLREQEKTKVVFRQYDGSVTSECGNCGLYLDKTYSVCPKCGKELDWNA